jgi:hypothetical protein
MKATAVSRWGLAAVALVLVVSHPSVALAPSVPRQDYAWTPLVTDAPRPTESPKAVPTATPRASEAPRGVLRAEKAPVAVAVPKPVRPRRVPKKVLPVSGTSLGGLASWYAYVPGGAAAGPRLRNALGPHWRGMTVRACAGSGRCVSLVLSDWCQCLIGARDRSGSSTSTGAHLRRLPIHRAG